MYTISSIQGELIKCVFILKFVIIANHSQNVKKHKIMKKQAVSHVFITFMMHKR